MGKMKKKHNWKSRQIVNTTIDKREEKKIVLDISHKGHFDEANPLVLPSKKRETKVLKPKFQNVKLLSKKKRKLLEKIVEKKKKKANREMLIEELSKVQATPDELNKMVSISTAQTKGLKRRYNEAEPFKELNDMEKIESAPGAGNGDSAVVSSIKGARKRKRLMAIVSTLDEKKKKDRNLNVIDLDPSCDESSSDDESIEIQEEDPEKEGGDNNSSIRSQISNNEVKKDEERKDLDCVESRREDSVKDSATKGNSVSGEVAARTPAVYVPVNRKAEIQEARLKLPILAEEQIVMEAINENPIIIIAGETGSGKTTQVPQFLYEAAYTRDGRVIGVTEPRRVAAISMAKRVGEELNLGPDEVSYLIRFEGNATPNTKIKFMTDGVLLKEMSSDFLLSKYSVIILDEAHERSVYTDILMGLLSRVVILRNKKNDPLKLIIMSATLKLEDFTENKNLFRTTPPVIKVEARQFPVTVHFNKRTSPDYVKEAYRKTCKIHTQLPDGGILVFLTGQQEVNNLVSKLRKAFPLRRRAKKKSTENGDADNSNKENEAIDEEVELDLSNAMQRIKKKKKEKQIVLPQINLDDYDVAPTDDTEVDLLASEDEELDDEDWDEEMRPSNAPPLWVLPLYSVLPSRDQAKVFQGAPDGCRLCIVATNVAETSLTIPGVKYVVDSGKVKTKLYDKNTGVSGFRITWASKAAANQRAGRAGRTSPGHCYRLYSSAVFNDEFEGWTIPEIQKRPVDELLLQMKSLGIDKVVNFPFPSPPDIQQLQSAEQRLTYLGALRRVIPNKGKDSWVAKLTPLGEAMSKFPVAPRYAKMLCLSHQHNLLEYTVALVAALSIQELLLTVQDNQQRTKNQRMAWAAHGNFKLLGDAMVLLRTIGGAEYANSRGKLEEFCNEHKIRLKGIIEARKIRMQLTNEINLTNPDLNLVVNPKMEPPSDLQIFINMPNTRLSKQKEEERQKLLQADTMPVEMEEVLAKAGNGQIDLVDQGDNETFNVQNSASDSEVESLSQRSSMFDSNNDSIVPNNAETPLASPAKSDSLTILKAKLLRQIVLSGTIDQVARKVDVPTEERTSKTRPLYHTSLLENTVQLHSSSVLYRDYPDWIVFQEIYETNKIYLRGVTAIEPEWLPTFAPMLCRLGTPLEDPPPTYDPASELIQCHVSGTFGKRGWELPIVEIEFPSGLEKYKWFAMYFLDGTIFPKLRRFTKDLLSTPKTMIRSWSRLQPRTEYFLKALVSKQTSSKKTLLETWETDSTYLLEAYQQWVPTSLHNEVAIIWPPVGLSMQT